MYYNEHMSSLFIGVITLMSQTNLMLRIQKTKTESKVSSGKADRSSLNSACSSSILSNILSSAALCARSSTVFQSSLSASDLYARSRQD